MDWALLQFRDTQHSQKKSVQVEGYAPSHLRHSMQLPIRTYIFTVHYILPP